MTAGLTVLAWGCVLGLVHIFAPAVARTLVYGATWNLGPRDAEMPPAGPLAERLARAQANFFETFPILVAAVLIVHAAGLENAWTAYGAWLWLGGRILYLPLYAFGVPVVRTLAFMASMVGLVLILGAALF
ncbi:MAPEG family protein [Roseococcus pinisoli]|uniref:MAPEG family protein n=1 Tax=Roseococcus pinisoli TaxID=2835040 RepID=A0ABS5Q9E7_9PROT|nr:MAPEG family protein [Roseococcus pinisoli]MBS7810345.1 MAPEG family protein [Roseococcus pinisoli]